MVYLIYTKIMEKIKKKVFIKIAVFILYIIATFLFRNVIFSNSYNESILMIHLCLIATFLITLNNDVIKSLTYNKEMSFWAIVISMSPIIIYFTYEALRDMYLPHNWLTTNYDLNRFGFFTEMLDFFYLFKAYRFDIVFLALIDSLLTLFFISVIDPDESNSFRKINGDVSFVLVKIGKLYLRYRFIIVFLMSICLAPQTYIYIRRVTYLIIAIFIIFSAIWLYICFKSIWEIKKSSKNKKLVLLVTLDNFDDNLLNEKNELNKLYKYRPSKSLNNMAIDSKRCIIARYELVRYNVINLDDYDDISYLVYYENKRINNLTFETVRNFDKKIEKISLENEEFVVVEINDYNDKNRFSEIMREKYKDNFRVNVSVENVLEELLEREKNKPLKDSIAQIIREIEKSQFGKGEDVILANRYILNTLQNMNTSDATRSYYALMKICEYIVHYRALKLVSINQNADLSVICETSFGKWRNLQKVNDERIKSMEISEAVRNIKLDLELKDTVQYSYDGICIFINSIRNKTIGHGVITYMVAKKIVNYFEKLVEVLIREFIKSEYILNETDCIKNIFDEDVKCIIKQENNIYLYNYARNGYENKYQYEYLNYETGKIINKGELPNIILNYKK